MALTYTSGSSASITSTTASPAGAYTLCLNASNGVSPNATQTFILTVNPASHSTTTSITAPTLTYGAESAVSFPAP